jgi:UDP-glucose:(heptosyl)LPS alpha-1,3-glucosyltransferase
LAGAAQIVGAGKIPGQQARQGRVGIGIDRDGRHAKRHCKVRKASIHANYGAGAGKYGRQLCQSHMRKHNDLRDGNGNSQRPLVFALAPPRQQQVQPLRRELLTQCRPVVDRPQLGITAGSMQADDVGRRQGNAGLQRRSLDAVIGGALRHGISQCKRRQLAVALYGMAAARHAMFFLVKQRGHRLARGCAVLSVQHTLCLTGDESTFQQALRIQDQIIALLTQPLSGRRHLAPGRWRPQPASPAPDGDGDHRLYRRVQRWDVGKALLHHPVEAHSRDVRTDVCQDRQIVDDVAQGRGLDDEESRHGAYFRIQFRLHLTLTPFVKFAFVIFKYFPYGGVQRDMLRFARACRRQGHAVNILAGEWQGERPETGIEVVLLPPSGWLNHQRRRNFIRRVTERLEQDPPDLVVGFNRMPGLDAWYAADPCYEERGRNERRWFYRLGGRYRFFSQCEQAVMRADGECRILLLSPREKAVYQKWYGTPDNRFIQLPPNIPWQAFDGLDTSKARHSLRAEFGFSDDDLVMLFVGSAFTRKGLDRAIQGLAALPPSLASRVRLLAVGQDNPGKMLALAHELGVADRLVITQGRNDIPRLMKGADLLVHPARIELAGNVLIEAMTAGLPVLASEECGYAMHVVRAGAGFVTQAPFEQAEFNRRLEELLSAHSRETWAQAGLTYTATIRHDTPEDYEVLLLVSLAREKAARS